MSRKRSTRIYRKPIVPFAGLSVAEDENWLTGRRVWVARYNDHAGFSDSCPLVACAEAMEHAARVGCKERSDDAEKEPQGELGALVDSEQQLCQQDARSGA